MRDHGHSAARLGVRAGHARADRCAQLCSMDIFKYGGAKLTATL